MNWDEYFIYDETSPSCLRWRVTRYKGRGYKQVAVLAGTVAGSLHVDGKYWQVKLNSISYKVHRIIFEMTTGRSIEKGNIVDHLNGTEAGNVPSNIREVVQKLNSRNRVMQYNSKTGINGVSVEEGSYPRARAVWYNEKGIRESRSFSILKYGKEGAIKLATEARRFAIESLNLNGAGYTERHGT